MFFLVNRFRVVRVKEIVHAIDPLAFITISEISDVFSHNLEGC